MKKIASILVSVFIIISTVTANAAYAGDKYISSQGACVMDYITGDILYEYNGYVRRVPASMTKLMTAYCIYRAIENGEISLDTVVPISQSVYYKSRDKLYQNMLALNMNAGYTVDELMGVSLTYSASAATVALAELVGGGSEANFVKRMNDTAKELGLDAVYYDSCGVKDNQITPVSMVTLARRLIIDYPDILTRTSKKSVTFRGGTYPTTNYLIGSSYYHYDGADGLKTGTGNEAGACFCGTAYKNGRRMIIVTMGSSTKDQRFVDAKTLLDYGYKIAVDKYGCIAYTDIRTFIDDIPLPTFYKRGDNPQAVIKVADLANCGFDVLFDEASRTVVIEKNQTKEPVTVEVEDTKSKNGTFAFQIFQSDIKVVLKNAENTYEFKNLYNANGSMCVSVDEFSVVFSLFWNNDERTISIKTV